MKKGGGKKISGKKISGKVLERFTYYKDTYKLSNIHYGKDAVDTISLVFFPNDDKERKKWVHQWSPKDSNSVYFIYKTKKGSGHRFISSAYKKYPRGEDISDLGQQVSKAEDKHGVEVKKRRTKKSKMGVEGKDWDNMYLEYNEGNSHKFWEITRDKTKITTRWGKQDTKGQELTKDYGSKAKGQYLKMIDAKKKKGYISHWRKPKRTSKKLRGKRRSNKKKRTKRRSTNRV